MARYRVGAGGNWNDTNYWSDASNGTTGFSVPGSGDDVFFDQYATGTVTVDVNASCKSIDFTSGTGFVGTFAGSLGLTIYGSLTLNSGMTRSFTGAITFAATGTGKTITLNTKTLASAITFNGSGGGWTFQDTFDNGTAAITLTNGTLDTNDVTVTAASFTSTSGTRTLNLGSSTINLSSTGTAWNLASSGLTFDAETSTIKLTGASGTFAGGGLTYYNVELHAGGNTTITGANTYNNLKKVITSAVYTVQITSATQTVNGTLTATGYSNILPLVLSSDLWLSTARTYALANAPSLTDVFFNSITVTGAAAPISGTRIGSYGNLTGINAETPVVRYWVGGTGNTNDSAHWSVSSNGAGGASIPLPQDYVYFDRYSFNATSTVTFGLAWMCGFDATDVDSTVSFAGDCSIFGDIKLKSGVTTSSTGAIYQMASLGNCSIQTDTGSIGGFYYGYSTYVAGNSYKIAASGTVRFTKTGSLNTRFPDIGEWDAGANDIYCDHNAIGLNANAAGYTAKIYMGSGTWYVSGQVWKADYLSGLVVDAGTATIKFTYSGASTPTFTGNKTWYNLWFAPGAGTGGFTIAGSNTFNDIKDDGTVSHNVNFTNSTTTTVTTWNINGTQFKPITIKNSSGTTRATISCANNITASNLVIQNLAKTGAGTFDAWESRDAGNNTGFSIRNGNAFLTF